MPRSSNFLVVAAFDLGTTYSGYAYSYKYDPTKIITNRNWYPGDAASKLLTLKTPTSVLLDTNGQFHSFGFEAEDHFAILAEQNENDGWRLFRRFKMTLHNNQLMSRQATVKDIGGVDYPAIDLFAMAIQYLHKHLLDALKLKLTGLLETDIQYVITVPAIWDISAKQFMREGAIKAGIEGDRLELAFESEVAAIWCTHELSSDAIKSRMQSPGSKYIVIDLGGGTADISVHQILPNGFVKALYKATGGAWGGTFVDQNFMEFLEQLLGKGVMEQFRTEQLGDYFEMIRDFETKKRSNSIFKRMVCPFRISPSLSEMVSATNTFIMQLKFGKLNIDIEEIKRWFDKPIKNLIEHIKELIKIETVKDAKTILFVGGFAESMYVQERLTEALPGMKLIVPDDAGLAVLKGAVLIGHFPEKVTSRVMTHTYGIDIYRKFDPKKHGNKRKVKVKSEWMLDNCFQIFVRANDEISLDHKLSYAIMPLDSITTVPVYRSLYENPEYTTDPGCELLGTLKIRNSDKVSLSEQNVVVIFMFGQTELFIKVRHEPSGVEEILSLDCLQ